MLQGTIHQLGRLSQSNAHSINMGITSPGEAASAFAIMYAVSVVIRKPASSK
jgi:hypothetical protein